MLTIREKADTVGTFRFIAVYLMETLARWVPTTPELEAKVLFGRHIWDCAQHADALGRRTAELRAAMHFTLPAAADYLAVLERLRNASGTGERIEGLYEVILPDVAERYRRYLADADPILDDPSIRIFERIVRDIDRLRADAERVRQERPDLPTPDPSWAPSLRSAAEAEDKFVAFRAARAAETA